MRYQNHFSENTLPYKESFRDLSKPFINHCHKEFEIVHIRRGSQKLIYHKDIYVLEEGEIAIIPPYICHATFPQPSQECEALSSSWEWRLLQIPCHSAPQTSSFISRSSPISRH